MVSGQNDSSHQTNAGIVSSGLVTLPQTVFCSPRKHRRDTSYYHQRHLGITRCPVSWRVASMIAFGERMNALTERTLNDSMSFGIFAGEALVGSFFFAKYYPRPSSVSASSIITSVCSSSHRRGFLPLRFVLSALL